MDRRTFLKILGVIPIFVTAGGIPISAASSESVEISFDQMIKSFLPGELVVIAGVNTSLLRKVLRCEIEKKGLIAINYSEWFRDASDEFLEEHGLWGACKRMNQTYRRMARRIGAPIVVIVHSDSNHRSPPLESDLFQFGGLNQEADKIIFAYRDPKPIGDGNFPILLMVGKNRSGPMWKTAKLSWSRGRLRALRATTPLHL